MENKLTEHPVCGSKFAYTKSPNKVSLNTYINLLNKENVKLHNWKLSFVKTPRMSFSNEKFVYSDIKFNGDVQFQTIVRSELHFFTEIMPLSWPDNMAQWW